MSPSRTRYNILVVEDNPGDYMLIEEYLLEQFDHPVITHLTEFRKVAAFWKTEARLPDVILLDLTLPDKSGEKLVYDMIKIATPVPIIIFTGFGDIRFSKKSISLGISDYLIKDELNGTVLFKSIVYAIERNKQVAIIKESEKRYSDLFNLSPQPMWLYDVETLRFIQVNQATVDHYGYSEAEFMQMTIKDLNAYHSKKKIVDAAADVKKEDESNYSGQFTHRKKSGELITLDLYSTAIVIENRQCRSIIAIDITDRVEFEHKVTKAIIKTQEEERYEIGSELHDNICQLLTTSLISLSFTKKSIAAEGIEHFQDTKKYIGMATDEIRNLSHRLAPAFFDNITFQEAVEQLITNLNLRNQFKVKFDYSTTDETNSLNKELQLNVYRIMQEQLRNVIKYSAAKNLCILIKTEKDKITLQMNDNGIGFNLNEARSGIGLANMKRRAELFGGTFRIESSPGNGCSLKVLIPIRQDS